MEEILSSIRRIIADEEGDKSDEDGDAHVAETGSEVSDEDPDDFAEDEDVLELTRMVRESGEVVDIKAQDAAAVQPGVDAAAVEPEADAVAAEPEGDAAAVKMDADAAPVAPEADGAGGKDEDLDPAYQDVEVAPAWPEPERPASHHTSQEDRSAVAREQAAAEHLVSAAASSAATGAFAKLSSAFQRTPPDEAVADESGRTVEQFVEDIIRPALREWMDENLPKIVERLVHKEIQKIARRAEMMD